MTKVTLEVEQDFIEELKKIAQNIIPSYNPNTYLTDKTVNDAYEIGREGAETDMAQWVLDQLGVQY